MLSSANEHVKNINRMKVDEENTPDVKDKSLVKRSILGGIAKASLATNAVLTNSKIAPKINRRSLLGDITNSAVKKQKTPSNFKSPFEIAVTKSSAKRTTPNLERTLSISGGSTYVASRLRITWNAEDEEIDYCSTLSTLDENQPTYTDTDLASDIQRRMQADCSDPEESPRVEENSGRVLSAVKLSNEWLQIQKNAREIAFEPLPFPRSEDCKFSIAK